MKVAVLLRHLREQSTGSRRLLGRCDEAALATALALGAKGAHVTALAAGPPKHEDEVLAHAIARGVHRALCVSDDCLQAVDYHSIAFVLARALKKTAYDLVLVGDSSEEERQGAVGPAVAEGLKLPHLSGVVEVTPEGTAVLATRREPGVLRTLRVPLPALLAIVACPRVAETKPIAGVVAETISLASLDIHTAELKSREAFLGHNEATSVPPSVTLYATADELGARLRDDLGR